MHSVYDNTSYACELILYRPYCVFLAAVYSIDFFFYSEAHRIYNFEVVVFDHVNNAEINEFQRAQLVGLLDMPGLSSAVIARRCGVNRFRLKYQRTNEYLMRDIF